MCVKVVRCPPAPSFEPEDPGFPGSFSFIRLEITEIMNFDSLKNRFFTLYSRYVRQYNPMHLTTRV